MGKTKGFGTQNSVPIKSHPKLRRLEEGNSEQSGVGYKLP